MKHVFVTAFISAFVLLSASIPVMSYNTEVVSPYDKAFFKELLEGAKSFFTHEYVDVAVKYGGDDATCLHTAIVYTDKVDLTGATACTPNVLLKALNLNHGSPCALIGDKFTFYLADQTCKTTCNILIGDKGLYAEVSGVGCAHSSELLQRLSKSPNAVKTVNDLNFAKINFYEKCDSGDGLFCDLSTDDIKKVGGELLKEEQTKTVVETETIPNKLLRFQIKFDHTETTYPVEITDGVPFVNTTNPQQLDFFILEGKILPGVQRIELVRSKEKEMLPLSFFTTRTRTPKTYESAEQQAALFAQETYNTECFLLKRPTREGKRTTICEVSSRDACYIKGETEPVTAEEKALGKSISCLRMYSTESGDVIFAKYLRTITGYGEPRTYVNPETKKNEERYTPEIDVNLVKVLYFKDIFPSAPVSETTRLAKKTP